MEFQIRHKKLGAVTVKISDEDADLAIRPWHLAGGKVGNGDPGKYVVGRGVYLHRVVAGRMGLLESTEPVKGLRGRWSVSIDHANGDKLDNRRSNLRLRDRPRQMRNRNDALRETNTSGFRGVSRTNNPTRARKPWRATVVENRRQITLGWFATAEDADAARRSYDAAADKAAWLAGRRSRAVASSGHRGVQAFPDGRFYAKTIENGQTISLGGYDTAEDAAAARQSYLDADDKATWLARLKTKPQSNGSSGYRGVSFLKQVRERQWHAYANKDKQHFNLGRYDTAEEAAAARRAWEAEQVTSASA